MTERPRRIQRKRTRGWKGPRGALYVGRPTIFGNPFTPEQYWAAGYKGTLEVALGHCVDAYRAWLNHEYHWAHSHNSDSMKRPPLETLRGKDLLCWCSLDSPCHADVLLEMANK